MRRLGKGSFGYAVLVERTKNDDGKGGMYVAKMQKYKHMAKAEKE